MTAPEAAGGKEEILRLEMGLLASVGTFQLLDTVSEPLSSLGGTNDFDGFCPRS